MEDFGRSVSWLQEELGTRSGRLCIVDCRRRELYDSSHVVGALSVALPSLMQRRLRKGSLSVQAMIPVSPQRGAKGFTKGCHILLYDESTTVLPRHGSEEEEPVLVMLLQKLREEGCQAFYLQDEALSQNCGVLVHCLAGISRSVTVTVAYLMQKLNLSLNDAYDLVKRKKSNISPNFNFLGQLMDFEKSLGRGSSDCDSQPAQEQAFFTTTTTDDSVFQLDST